MDRKWILSWSRDRNNTEKKGIVLNYNFFLLLKMWFEKKDIFLLLFFFIISGKKKERNVVDERKRKKGARKKSNTTKKKWKCSIRYLKKMKEKKMFGLDYEWFLLMCINESVNLTCNYFAL